MEFGDAYEPYREWQRGGHLAAVLLLAMPQNPDPEPGLDGALLDGFEAASIAAAASFWAAAGVILGALWPLRNSWAPVQPS